MNSYIIFRYFSFLIYTFKDINFPRSIALAASYKWWYVIFFTIIQLYYLIIHSCPLQLKMKQIPWGKMYCKMSSSLLWGYLFLRTFSQVLTAFFNPRTYGCQKLNAQNDWFLPSLTVVLLVNHQTPRKGKWWRISGKSMCLPSFQDLIPSHPNCLCYFPFFFFQTANFF